jgi:hypothetical protein
MMCKWLVAFSIFLSTVVCAATPSDFARRLCREEPATYMCATVKIPKKAKRQYKEWAELFPNATMRHIVMSINRRNTLIWTGHTVAVPRNYTPDLLAYRPFPGRMKAFGSRFVVVDLKILAWAAYMVVAGSQDAVLVRWGVANGGSKICKETGRLECKTHPGLHQILRLHGPGKRSDLYPIDCADKKSCGHQMPHYMPFHRDGTGLHGDRWLVGRNASHGCTRMLRVDAKWLNQQFAYVGMPVLVENY